MMRFNSIYDKRCLLVLATQIRAYLDMRTFHLLVNRLSDIVQKTYLVQLPLLIGRLAHAPSYLRSICGNTLRVTVRVFILGVDSACKCFYDLER